MIYHLGIVIANITKAMNEHHNNDTNHHMIKVMHTQINILGKYWILNMKNEKYYEW